MDKENIKKMYFELQSEKRKDWMRVLPFAELLVERDEKAKFLGFEEGSTIYDSSIVMGNVIVGKNTWIGPNTLLDGTGGELNIGSFCDISAGVQIYTHDSIKRCISGGIVDIEKGNVAIGNNCYIAPMSIITKGVTIGECSIVAAHTMVNKSFEPYSIIAGTPAKQIGRVVKSNTEVILEYF